MEAVTPPPTAKGAADRFVGDVFVDAVTRADAGVTVAWVHFTPGARNAWHTHSTGQTLHCTAGYGLVVTDDEVIALAPGVSVWTPPGQRHWHAALPEHFMTHLAISANPTDGSAGTQWADHVTGDEYAAAVATIRTP